MMKCCSNFLSPRVCFNYRVWWLSWDWSEKLQTSAASKIRRAVWRKNFIVWEMFCFIWTAEYGHSHDNKLPGIQTSWNSYSIIAPPKPVGIHSVNPPSDAWVQAANLVENKGPSRKTDGWGAESSHVSLLSLKLWFPPSRSWAAAPAIKRLISGLSFPLAAASLSDKANILTFNI